MINLERICKHFARITCDSVDPGGSIDSQLEKDLQRLGEDPRKLLILGGGGLHVHFVHNHEVSVPPYIVVLMNLTLRKHDQHSAVRVKKTTAYVNPKWFGGGGGGEIDNQYGKD